jgi:hypothetical protein
LIVYSLVCQNGHEFEGWFKDSAAFDAQSAKGKITCPSCPSRKVTKAVMAPRLSKGAAAPAENAPAPLPIESHARGADPKLANLMAELRSHVEKHYDYVGEHFAEEARRIHYGETEERRIYGEAKADEVKALLDEGVEIAPLPPLPRRDS